MLKTAFLFTHELIPWFINSDFSFLLISKRRNYRYLFKWFALIFRSCPFCLLCSSKQGHRDSEDTWWCWIRRGDKIENSNWEGVIFVKVLIMPKLLLLIKMSIIILTYVGMFEIIVSTVLCLIPVFKFLNSIFAMKPWTKISNLETQ